MPKARPTMADVARAAGVSPTTVSHALNGKGRVDPATRERVAEVADSLGYRPHRTARGLALGRSDTIGLWLARIGELPLAELMKTDWYGRVLLGAGHAALQSGYALTIVPDTDDAGDLAGLGLAGMVVLDPTPDDPRCRLLDEAGLPYATIGIDPTRPHITSVTTDNAAAVTGLLDQLASQRARSLAIIRTDLPWEDERVTVARVTQAWSADSFDVRSHVVEIADAKSRDEILDRARTVSREVLGGADRPDAVLVLFEDLVFGVLDAAAELRLDVPGDVLVAQDIDGVKAQMGTPGITAIELHPMDLAAAAVALVVNDGESTSVRSDLVLRASTGPRPLTPRGRRARRA